MTATLFQELQNALSQDLTAFAPELLLCGGIVALLLIRLFRIFDRNHLGWIALVLTLGALGISVMQWLGVEDYDPRFSTLQPSMDLFTGLLVYDNFTIFVKLFLYGFASLIVFLSLLTG